jgi:hypothetical protein
VNSAVTLVPIAMEARDSSKSKNTFPNLENELELARPGRKTEFSG